MRVIDPNGRDVTFVAANDPHGVVATGWLRASHRKLDPDKSLPYRPWHTHDERQPLISGETYELDVEIWPTSVNLPAGYRFGFTVGGRTLHWMTLMARSPLLTTANGGGRLCIHTKHQETGISHSSMASQP